MQPLQFGFSPCPNDTFAFHALVHGCVTPPCPIVPVMDDIEALNQRARTEDLELTKLSIGALAAAGEAYVPLSAGAALGFGVGPLVVAQTQRPLRDVRASTIAIPGRDTTAYLLLRLALGEEPEHAVEMRYDQILGAVARGDVDAGLIIHESRFTYAAHGLERVADLGDWWQHESGMPVPLAVICARRDVDPALRNQLSDALRDSVQYAFDHPDASRDFVRTHAQEMTEDVCRQHIALYVNQHSIDLGEAGLAAINALLAAAGRH